MAKAESLDFDPRSDVRCVADLVRFPDVSPDLRDVRVEQLVPKGIREGTPRVFESGGTTGRPKRIVDFTAWDEEAATTNSALDEHAFPAPDIFPGIKFAGQYGNTVMGATMQRPRGDDDPARCVFRSLYPRAHVDVVDFADPTRLVAYGARPRPGALPDP